MHIINIGNNWVEPTFEDVEERCGVCNSKLKISYEDIKMDDSFIIFKKRFPYYVCPVCFVCNALSNRAEKKYINYKSYISRKKYSENKASDKV